MAVVHRGNKKIYTEDNLDIEGRACTVYGKGCRVKGNGNDIYGDNCTSDGSRNKLRGFGCTSTGPKNTIYNGDCIEINGFGNKHVTDTKPDAVRRRSVHLDGFLKAMVTTAVRRAGPPPNRRAPVVAPVGVDRKTEDPNMQCVICLDNEKCCLISPCQHLSLCISCAGTLNTPKCPLCRGDITAISRVFL